MKFDELRGIKINLNTQLFKCQNLSYLILGFHCQRNVEKYDGVQQNCVETRCGEMQRHVTKCNKMRLNTT